MPKVRCNVENCSYNERHTCYAVEILISGQGAINEELTCCGSFLNKEAYSNLGEFANYKRPTNNVSCKVETCKYQMNDKCTKQEIEVDSRTPAHIYIETCCNSFQFR